MATVNSLIAWGGRTGKTVSLSATTDVVTLTNHGLRNGTKLWPSGTLPAELNTSTPVYARSTAADTFTLHTSSAGAIANTGQITFAGASTYAAVVLKSDLVANAASSLAAYGLSDLSRWGSSGSERIYDGVSAWHSARTGAGTYDTEVCEVGESFEDWIGTQTFNLPSAAVRFESKINNIRTPAFHYGIKNSGYCIKSSSNYTDIFTISGIRTTIDGVTFAPMGSDLRAVTITGLYSVFKNNYVVCQKTQYDTCGVWIACIAGLVFNNISADASQIGIRAVEYSGAGTVVANNLAVGCTRGIAYLYGGENISGWYLNNAAVGCTTANWGTKPALLTGAGYNAGISTDTPWFTGTDTTVKTLNTTTHWANYAAFDYTPTSTSPLVDAGVSVYDVPEIDLLGDERPNYNNGGAEYWDIGPYEYDHGYTRPASHVLTLNNVVVGSRVFIRDQADTTTHYNDIAASSTVVVTITVYGDSRDNWRIRIRKASAAPKYLPYETLMTATPGSSSIYVSQLPDPIAS